MIRNLSVSGKLAALCGAFLIPIAVLGYSIAVAAWTSLASAELEIRGVDSLQLVWPVFETIASGKDILPDTVKTDLDRADSNNMLGLDNEVRALAKSGFSLDLMRDGEIIFRKLAFRSNLAFDPQPENAFLVKLATDDLIRLVKDTQRMTYRGPKDANSVAFARLDEGIREIETTVKPSGGDLAVKEALVDSLKVLDQKLIDLLGISATLNNQTGANDEFERAAEAAAQGIGTFWQNATKLLRQRLQARIETQRTKLSVIIASAGVALSLCILVAVLSALSVRRGVMGVLRSLDLLSSGNLSPGTEKVSGREFTLSSPQTFAGSGFGGQLFCVDPERELTFVHLVCGYPQLYNARKRSQRIADLIISPVVD